MALGAHENQLSVKPPGTGCRGPAIVEAGILVGHGDDGGRRWADLASLIEPCKLNGVNPQVYLTDLLTRLVNGWPQSRIDELMPWHWAPTKTS